MNTVVGAVGFWVVVATIIGFSVHRIRKYRIPAPWNRHHRAVWHGGRPPVPHHVRRMVYARDGWQCRWCHTGADLQVDHIVPRSRGGADHLGNYQTLCGRCNRLKGATIMRQPHVAPWISGEYTQPYRGGQAA